MRVLQLIGSTGFYGAEAVVAALATSLPSAGIETCVGHMRYARPGVLKLEERLPDCDVFALPHRLRMDAGLLKRLYREIKRRNIAAIHSHGYKPDFYAGVAARLAGIPVISTCHLWTRATRALRAYARIDALLLRRFNRVVAVSQPIMRELKTAGVREDRLDFIPNGVAVQQFLSSRPAFRQLFPYDAFIFGAACRQVSAKGVDTLLRAMQHVAALLPRARLLIAGDGPSREDYRQMAQQLRIGDKVVFLGRCDSMPEFYASLDTFVLPSLDEGLPVALLEAMASARMVIATNVGSVKDVVHDQENGLLIPPGNVLALTSAMLSVTSNQDRLSRFAGVARGTILAHYSSCQMVNRYASIYRGLANSRW